MNSDSDNELLALNFLSKANSYFLVLESHVISNKKLFCDEFIEVVDTFTAVYNEALDCVRDNHPHQHTVIYFNQFKESLKPALDLIDSDVDLEQSY